VAAREGQVRTNSSSVAAVTFQATPPSEPRLLTLGLGDNDHQPVMWMLENPPRLQLASVGAYGEASASGPANQESLFSTEYWRLVGRDIEETFTAPIRWETRDWLVFSGIAAGIGTVAAFDQDIRHAVQRNRNGTVDSVFNAVEPLGGAYAPAVLGVFYAGGEIFQDPREKSVALDGLSASIIASGLIIQPLKYGLGRHRPSDNESAYHFQPFSGNDSLPSGHTAEAFALATVIAEHYDSPWIRLASYGLASAVGYARLNKDAHWASDVVAGAAIGTFVGHVVVHFNEHQRTLFLQPIVEPDMRGVQLGWSF
jgi:membrane-associated phospholipid phosphatase